MTAVQTTLPCMAMIKNAIDRMLDDLAWVVGMLTGPMVF